MIVSRKLLSDAYEYFLLYRGEAKVPSFAADIQVSLTSQTPLVKFNDIALGHFLSAMCDAGLEDSIYRTRLIQTRKLKINDLNQGLSDVHYDALRQVFMWDKEELETTEATVPYDLLMDAFLVFRKSIIKQDKFIDGYTTFMLEKQREPDRNVNVAASYYLTITRKLMAVDSELAATFKALKPEAWTQ